MIEIRNDSNPPLTQSGERTLEVCLPANAKIDSVLAAGPGKIATLISAAAVPGEPGRYALNFPLQPGATKFAFNYDLPYDGHATFRPKSMYALQQLAVMVPQTMKFESRSHAFQSLRAAKAGYQVEAANVVSAGEGPVFEISGVGMLPDPVQSPPRFVAAQPDAAIPATASSQARTHASGLDVVSVSGIPARSALAGWRVWGVSAIALGICGLLVWRRERRSDNTITTRIRRPEQDRGKTLPLVGALKEELLQLEIDRSLGTIAEEEYASAKKALEGTAKRALTRAGAS